VSATVTALRMFVRVAGLVMVTLGLLFWTGNALGLLPIHMLIGLLLVLSLWTLAALAAAAGVNPALVALAFVWGLLVPALGVTQERLLPGTGHWVIQVLHLLVGLSLIALAESLARRTLRRRQEVARQAA
jgi:hypothetical protein